MRTTRVKRSGALLGLGLATALLTSSCLNVFSPFDHATTDTQLLSAARACFDEGDFVCAQRLYGKISNNLESIRDSEEVFATLDQLGAGMNVFMKAIGKGSANAGSLLTSIAASMSFNASQATRTAVYNAYLTAKAITPADPQTRGLTRFVAAMALMAEILGEDASIAGGYPATDLVANVTTCLTETSVTCTNAACADGGKAFAFSAINTTLDLDTAPASTFTGPTSVTPSIPMLHYSLMSIQSALNEMGSTSGVSGSALSLAGQLANLTGTANCYLWGLLTNNVGSR